MICSHGVVTFLPVHWANFTVLLEVLESIDYPEAFVDRPTEWHVVDNLVANSSSLVDEEEATVSYELTLDLDVIVFVENDVTREYIIIF